MLRVIIAGGRHFTDYAMLCIQCDDALRPYDDITIISGTAHGADQLGERYAKDRGYPVVQYPADWDTHGRSAGYKRNQIMADNADALIAFWDGKSRGTMHMINIADSHNLKVRVCKY